MPGDISIQLTNISKKYTLTHQKASLVGSLLGKSSRLRQGFGEPRDFWALKDVNLTIKKGDRIGIIGPNGAGKSTLLKIIAGITKPSAGTVKTNGKVVALLDLEAGFHPDLTGEENIYINGMLVGMTRSEIAAKKSQIIQFADIGEFIYAPFHTYSAGMKFRLAFAVAMASECEVLIMDEVFVAGDIEFQAKATHLLTDLQKKNEVTTIMCSHVPVLIWKYANLFLSIDKGELAKKNESQIMKSIQKEARLWNASYIKSVDRFKEVKLQ